MNEFDRGCRSVGERRFLGAAGRGDRAAQPRTQATSTGKDCVSRGLRESRRDRRGGNVVERLLKGQIDSGEHDHGITPEKLCVLVDVTKCQVL